MVVHLAVYILSFAGIWFGSGLTVKSVERLAHSLRISSFSLSFLVLGLVTSISEFSVGVNAVIDDNPEIYVGNLIGASIVLFMLIIPLLAVVGHQIKITKELQGMNLIMSLIVVAAPVVLSFDGNIGKIDGIITVVIYTILALAVQIKTGVMEKILDIIQFQKTRIGVEFTKIIIGFGIIFLASHSVVEKTVYFSHVLGLSPFLISLLVIGLGTNLPELSFVVQSIFRKSNQVAFGDYVGSAAFNTYLFGLFTLWYGKTVILTNSYLISLVFLVVGLVLFYIFARSKNTLSKKEGLVLFGTYVLFILSEIWLHAR